MVATVVVYFVAELTVIVRVLDESNDEDGPPIGIITSGTTTTLGVYSAGTTTATRVTLGVEGNAVVQVKDGLTVGDEVVLANLDEALPSSDSSSTSGSSLTGGSGGFGGSGSFSGGSRPGGGSGGPP